MGAYIARESIAHDYTDCTPKKSVACKKILVAKSDSK